jgi:steroid delta-isomerase-like uncharacterized protein
MGVQEDNKALVRRWFDEVVSNGNLDTLDAICAACAPSFVVIKGTIGEPQGIPGLRDLIMNFRRAYPDLQAVIEDQIAEGDKVVTRLTMKGTHRGEIMGIPATNRPFSISGTSIWEVKNGLLIQEHVNWDALGMLQQLGVMPNPAEAVPA